jgi:hypothetical protein
MKINLLLECAYKLAGRSRKNNNPNTDKEKPVTTHFVAADLANQLRIVITGLLTRHHRKQSRLCSNCARMYDNLKTRCKHIDKTHPVEEMVFNSANKRLQTLYVVDIITNEPRRIVTTGVHVPDPHPPPPKKKPFQRQTAIKIIEFESILSRHTRQKQSSIKDNVGTTMIEWLGILLDNEIFSSQRVHLDLPTRDNNRNNRKGYNNSIRNRSWRMKCTPTFSDLSSSSSSSSSSFRSAATCQDRLNRNIRRLYKSLSEDKKFADKTGKNVDEKSGMMFKVNVCHVLSMIVNRISHRKSDRKRSSVHLCT